MGGWTVRLQRLCEMVCLPKRVDARDRRARADFPSIAALFRTTGGKHEERGTYRYARGPLSFMLSRKMSKISQLLVKSVPVMSCDTAFPHEPHPTHRLIAIYARLATCFPCSCRRGGTYVIVIATMHALPRVVHLYP